MTQWPSTKARKVLRALKSIGWKEVRSAGSHKVLVRPGYLNYVFSFHSNDEIGLARIAKHTGLQPKDL